MGESHAPFCLAIIAVLWLLPWPAAAQRPCLPRADVLFLLEGKYDEHLVAVAVAKNGTIIEILASKGGATWTMLSTSSTGISCIAAAGENWRVVPPKSDGPPA